MTQTNVYGENIILTPGDGHLVLISALRYTFGRQTYMPSAIIKIIKEHWDHIAYNTKYVMVRDVEEEITFYERSMEIYNEKEESKRDFKPCSLGGEIDVKTWYAFRDWLREQNIDGE